MIPRDLGPVQPEPESHPPDVSDDGDLPADQVEELVQVVRTSIEALRDALPRLYHGRAWIAAGLADWETFCAARFGGIKFPKLDRAEAVQELAAEGMSVRAIATGLGVGKSTVARDLAPVPDGTVTVERPTGPEIVTPHRLAVDDPDRLDRIRELAGRGEPSSLIAIALGLSESYIRKLAKDADIRIPADEVLRGTRRGFDHDRIVTETINTLDGLTIGIDLLDLDQVHPLTAEQDATLAEAMRVLNLFTRKIRLRSWALRPAEAAR